MQYSRSMQRWRAFVQIVGREKLHSFCETHRAARKWIANWLGEVEAALWKGPMAIKERYPAASFLGHNVVIFNVKGNAYRLEVVVAYRTSVVNIVWAGTHAEYDRRKARH
jgi:mRNA interferase HigB